MNFFLDIMYNLIIMIIKMERITVHESFVNDYCPECETNSMQVIKIYHLKGHKYVDLECEACGYKEDLIYNRCKKCGSAFPEESDLLHEVFAKRYPEDSCYINFIGYFCDDCLPDGDLEIF